MAFAEYTDYDGLGLAHLVNNGEVSPGELVEAAIERIERHNGALNAVVYKAYDEARAAAASLPDGPFKGVPFLIKDLGAKVKGWPRTSGSNYAEVASDAEDSALVRRYRASGVVLIGKTNTPEFGAGANTRNAVYGATGNPFNPQLSAAGSSGGSAVALATGMVPLATGSDTGGSLRNPAAFCGIVGFRPTPGLVPSERRGLGWSPLPVNGPMARTVPDLCLLMSAIAGNDLRDPLAMTI